MSFKITFKGGPLDKQTEERKGAPQVLHVDPDKAQGQVGHYSLTDIKGQKAKMVWRQGKVQ